jgi:membrane protease YdiL (CAAX protease family)
MNEPATAEVSHPQRRNTGRVSVDLSSRQLILPAIPLILLVAFGFTFHPNATVEPKLQWSGKSEKDGNGEITLQVDKTLMIEGSIDWWIGPFLVHKQSVSRLYEEIPEINRGIEETRGWWMTIAGAFAFAGFIPAAWSQKWHGRWGDGPPRVASGRAILIVVCVLSFLVGVCWLFKGMNPEPVAGLAQEFSGARNLGWRMVAVIVLFPIAEELVFRAMLQRLLARRLTVHNAVLIQALCFGAVHLATPMHVLIGVFGGLSFGMIYAATNRLSLTIATHCGSNAIFILLIL